ncbi:MAG: glycoside hydrolase family 2, partial [Planctomycetota bacterium]
ELDRRGRLTIDYEWTLLADVDPRQWGISLEVPMGQGRLRWSRDAEWTTYPDDHIGRPQGAATPAGITTPAGRWPDHPWSLDASPRGSNDFRATRRNVRHVSLVDAEGVGVGLASEGRHASRCWVDDDRIRWLIAGFDHPGAERFLRRHVAAHDRPLRRGDRISDAVALEVLRGATADGERVR